MAWFYDNSILSGTKIDEPVKKSKESFTITQFFQVLKFLRFHFFQPLGFTITQFFQVLKCSYPLIGHNIGFTITQFFQVLKYPLYLLAVFLGFTITQFFQVLKYQIDNFLDISAPFTITLYDYITSFSIKKAFSKEFKPLSTDVLIQSVS